MQALGEIPLFRCLPAIELARLLPDVEFMHLHTGDMLDPRHVDAPSLYVLTQGCVELVTEDEVSYGVVEAGDTFAEELLTGEPLDYLVRCLDTVDMVRIPMNRISNLCQRYPRLMKEILQLSQRRLVQNRRQAGLVRSEMAFPHQAEYQAPRDHAAATVTRDAPPHRLLRVQQQPLNRRAEAEPGINPWGPLQGWKAAGVVGSLLLGGVLVVLLPVLGVERSLAVGISALAWALVNWMLDTMPDYVVGLATIGVVVATGAVPSSVALSGFSNSTWFLSLAVLGIGSAISRSGILFRFSLHMLKTLPSTYWGQVLALAVSGLALTPMLPSPSGRIAISSPLAVELAEAMRLRDRSPGAAGLGMTVLLAFGQMYFLFLNGTGSCILLWNLLPESVRSQVTWGYWLIAALPLGLIVFAGGYLTILWLFRPDSDMAVDRRVLIDQLEMLGPMSQVETLTLSVVILMLLAFLTAPWHGIDPAWVGIGGLLYLVTTGILDRDGLRRSIDWSFLLLYGSLIGLAAIMSYTRVDQLITRELGVVFEPFVSSPLSFLILVVLMTTIVRVATPMVAASLMMAVALYPIAPHAGISPFVVTLAVQVSSNPWFLPHQNTFYQNVVTGTEGRAFTHSQVRPFAWVYVLLTILGVVASIPWWRWLGLIG